MNYVSYDDKMKMCQQKYDNQLPEDTSEFDEYAEDLLEMLTDYGYVWSERTGHIDYDSITHYVEGLDYYRLPSQEARMNFVQYKELQSYFGSLMIESLLKGNQ